MRIWSLTIVEDIYKINWLKLKGSIKSVKALKLLTVLSDQVVLMLVGFNFDICVSKIC